MPGRRRRREVELERVLGTPALFATAYGNVGSSIYYALGLTAVYRARADAARLRDRGARSSPRRPRRTPRGRRASRRPAARRASRATRSTSSSASWRRWAQMLVLRRHGRDLGVLRPALPLDLLGAAADEPVGHRRRDRSSSSSSSRSTSSASRRRRSSRLSLAVVDFATQVLLVIVGFALVFSPRGPRRQRALGDRADVVQPRARDPGGDARLHRGRDRLEPRRGGARPGPHCPERLQARRRRRLRHLLHAAARRALGAAGAGDRRRADDAARRFRRRTAASRTTRFSASSRTSGSRGAARRGPRIYVGILAATILVHRDERGRDRRVADHLLDGELPAAARGASGGCTRASRRRGSRSSSSPGSPRSCCILPGDVNFIGTLYSFGATLSFTIAHASIVRLRMRDRRRRRGPVSCPPEPPDRRRRPGRSSRCSAGSRHGALVPRASFCRTRRRAGSGSAGSPPASSATRSTGGASVHVPLRETVEGAARARPGAGARVPATCSSRSFPGQSSDDAMDVACRLAAERRAPHRRSERARGSARPAARRATYQGELEELANARARRGGGDRQTPTACASLDAARARAARRAGDRRRGRCAQRGDHRPRVTAQADDRARVGRVRLDRRLRPQACALPCHGDCGMRSVHARGARVLRRCSSVLGVALLVRTAAAGGGVVGYVLAALFIVLGVARFTLERQRRS